MSQSPSDFANQRAGATELTESDRHRLLAVERRRVALDVLANRTTPVELEDLAKDVAMREAERGEHPDDAIQQATITLHHNHLPMMTDVGVIEYDPTSRRIESVWVTPDSHSR